MQISKNSIFSNVIWRFLERISAQLVSFVVSLIIARILSPEHYGTVALITVFIDILNVFVDSGLGTSLIQKKDADTCDFSTVFFANIVYCILLYSLMFCVAPFIARFYGNKELTILIRILSCTILISGLKNIQQAYVAKNLIFKKFFFATLVGTVCAAIIGIWMAYNGFGVWALVTQQLTNLSIDTIILWLTVKWRPTKEFSFKRLRSLYSFGWKMLLTSLINTTYCKFRELIIGKVYSAEELAYYNRGHSLAYFIVNNVDNSISSVMFPTLSNNQDSKDDLKNIVKKTVQVSTYVLSPCLLGLAAISDNLITFLLTEKWIFCSVYLKIFAIGYILYPLYTANLNAYAACGKSDLYLKIEVIKKSIGLVVLVALIRYGVMAIAISFLIERIEELFVDLFPSKKLINYGIGEQMKDVLPHYGISLLMATIVYFVGKIKIAKMGILIIQIASGVLIYYTFSKIFRIKTFNYLKNMISFKVRQQKG